MEAKASVAEAPLPLLADRFHCSLDGLPLHLVPQRQLAFCNANTSSLDFFPNPDCVVLDASQIPDSLKAYPQLLDGFSLQGMIAWVRDAGSGMLNPFWLGPHLVDSVSRAHARRREDRRSDASSPLVRAGILVPQDYLDRRKAEWKEATEKGSRIFREKQYLPLRRLIHPFHVAALRRYYRHRIRSGAIRLGDDQSSRRYVVHNEPVARFFHHQLSRVVSAVAGQPVKPSYVYLASYLGGAVLKKHTDREQCEFSVTLCLDFSPEPDFATPWPIRLETPQGTAAVYQALGDGLLYRGTKVPHFRGALGGGFTSTSIFFHYVPQDFTGTLN